MRAGLPAAIEEPMLLEPATAEALVVVTTSCEVFTALLPVKVMVDGVKVQVVRAGRPLQASVSEP